MNILVIGNGFDIEHGIPSSYKNFLDFIRAYIRVYEYRDSLDMIDENNFQYELCKISSKYKNPSLLLQKMQESKSIEREFGDVVSNNCWVQYFFDRTSRLGGKYNWVDFEAEILYAVQMLSENRDSITGISFAEREIEILKNNRRDKNLLSYVMNRLLEKKPGQLVKKQEQIKYWQKMKVLLLKDFSYIIRALEIYLDYFIDFEKVKEDHELQGKESCIFTGIKFNRLITFNYTNTYSILYDSDIYKDFIHGKADFERDNKESNMVLGIEEFLPEGQKNKDIEFIAYRKYYQRIVKRCDFSYRNYLEKQGGRSVTWIFGHSLAVSDKDVLIKLLPCSDFAHNPDGRFLDYIQKSYICYYDKQALEQQVANLVQILGQDALNDLVCGANPKIKFVHQKDFRKELMLSIGSKKN